jgi:hypothetical protein
MNELIPFGKYKGQPVDQLRNDSEYTAWLLAQPWFAQRFGSIKTLIVNHFKEPSETPEHNRLQARFLDEDFAKSVAVKAYPSLKRFEQWDSSVAAAKEKYTECCLQHYGDLIEWKDVRNLKIVFETKQGWDVGIFFDYELFPFCPQQPERAGPKSLHGKYPRSDAKVFAELKPTLGDEYPRVLRDVKCRQGKGFVFAERFCAHGASEDEVKAIYRSSGVMLLFESDLSK